MTTLAQIEALHYRGRIRPDALVVKGETITLHDVGCPTCLTSWPCPTMRVIQDASPTSEGGGGSGAGIAATVERPSPSPSGPCDHEAQIRDLLEEREELLTEIRRLRMGNHPAGRALRAVDRCPHDYAPCPFCPSDALAEALTERDAEHEGGEGA